MRCERVVARIRARQTDACESHRAGVGHVFIVEVTNRSAAQADGVAGVSLTVATGASARSNGGLQCRSAADHSGGGGVVYLVGRRETTHGQRLGIHRQCACVPARHVVTESANICGDRVGRDICSNVAGAGVESTRDGITARVAIDQPRERHAG